MVAMRSSFCSLIIMPLRVKTKDQVLDLVRDQLMRQGGEVQLAQVDIAEKSLPLPANLCRDVVRVTLILALETGGIVGYIDIEPLLVVVEMDTESRFAHFRVPFGMLTCDIICLFFLGGDFLTLKNRGFLHP